MPFDFTQTDRQHMQRALTLAQATLGLASPNPQVGCVLAHGNNVVGEGAHRYDLLDHAEIVALKHAGASAVGATAYVTLEPCSHHGRTGPCANALIEAGVARVVAATLDPNPRVAGSGMARIEDAGILAQHGLLESEARRLNDAFAHYILSGRPLVTLKAALSVDGKLAPPVHARTPGETFWLTGIAAREEVHRLRHASDALLSGVGTILADDSLLTDRSALPRRRPLLRVVLDTDLRIPLTSRIVESAREDLLIFCGEGAFNEAQRAFRTRGVQVEIITERDDAGRIDLQTVLQRLGERQILSVLLEAGSTLNAAALSAKIVDKAVLFFSETELGASAIPFADAAHSPFQLIEQLQEVERCDYPNASGGFDACVRGSLHDPWADVFTLTPG